MDKMKGCGAKGFTLIEVMIAMSILAIALVAVFQSQSQSVSLAAEGRFLTTASLLAQGKMTEIESAEPKGIAPSSGNFGDDFPDYAWQLEVKDTQFEYLKKIDLYVKNNKMAAKNVYHLESYKLIAK